jgi:hypothetical protein
MFASVSMRKNQADGYCQRAAAVHHQQAGPALAHLMMRDNHSNTFQGVHWGLSLLADKPNLTLISG